MHNTLLSLGLMAGSAFAGAVLWDGRFNDLETSEDLNDWSWSNQVGPYQYYIHGSGDVTDYVNLSEDYKNPADTSSEQGVKITIDSTSYWNGQDMRRTELIPQTTAAINSGKVYYHFSISRSDTNAPSTALEHQVNFFESHFTELKYGLLSGASGTSDDQLRWMVSQVTYWNTTFEADVWHNMAYEIDFSGATVGFWHSTDSDDLEQVVSPVSASPSSNGADWHLGVLRLLGSSSTSSSDIEDWYFSGVYVESGDITTSVSGPVSSGSGSSSSSASTSTSVSSVSSTSATSTKASSSSTPAGVSTTTTTTSRSSTTLATSTSTSAAASATAVTASTGTIEKYAQCGGTGWTGSGTCVSGTTCTELNDYYYQCL